MIEFYVAWIEIGDNPVGAWAERWKKGGFCYRKARNRKKKRYFLIKKKNANYIFGPKNVIFDPKKAPAAIGQPEENGFWPKTPFFAKKRRLRQAASWRKIAFFLEKRYLGQKKAPAAIGQPEENGFSQKISYPILPQLGL